MSIIIFLAMFTCIVVTCVIFQQRDEKWWYALIPGYNKYIFGKLCNQKKVGTVLAVANLLWDILLVYLVYFEYQLSANYYAGMYDATTMILNVPEEMKIQIDVLRIIIMVIAAVYMATWTYVMYKFSAMHGKSPKWVFGWAIAPVFLLCYFALSNKVAMYGKMYVLEKKEIALTSKINSKDNSNKSIVTKLPRKKHK